MTISALSAFKPKNQPSLTTIPGNQADIIPSNHVCDSKCDCEIKQDDVIDKVAKAQAIWPGRKSPDRKKEITEGFSGSTRRKSVPVTNQDRKVSPMRHCRFSFTVL